MTKQETHSAQEWDTVLLVDDEPNVLSALTRVLRNTGYQVLTARSGKQALEIMESTLIKVIVSDEMMAGMRGLELLAVVKKRFPHTLRMLLTGHATLETAIEAVNDGGIYRFLTKPWDDDMLLLALSAATEKYNFADEKHRLRDALRAGEHYRTLVEWSPHAVLFQRDLKILYANPAAIKMFAATSLQDLADKPLLDRIHPDDHQAFLTRLHTTTRWGVTSPMLERRYLKLDGTAFIGEIQGTPIIYDGLPAIHLAIQDITDRKQADEYREMRQEILSILNEAEDSPDSIKRILAVLKAQTGCNAVAIRLQEGEDFPYFAQDGFPADFLRTENTLISHDADGLICRDKEGNSRLECTCGLVLRGRTDPASPLFTHGGSFWTNDSFTLFALPSVVDPRHHPHNQCMHRGYASFALVPLRDKNRIVGLIQFNDRRKGHFTLATVEYLEIIAAHIGMAMVRRRAEEALQEAHDLLELRVAERTGELWTSNETLRAEITTRHRAEGALNARSQQLEETNTTLKVLLNHRAEEMREMEKKIVVNIQKLVLPYIGELKQLHLSPGQSGYVELINANLQQVINPFLQNLAARFSAFTPREIQIANLIKEGKTSKVIAALVKAAPRSVEFHRNNIRRKLGLGGKKTNLRSFLLTLS
ncbi:MAG: response regulator [Syntrophales bacterium]